jgi:hypothetical protein
MSNEKENKELRIPTISIQRDQKINQIQHVKPDTSAQPFEKTLTMVYFVPEYPRRCNWHNSIYSTTARVISNLATESPKPTQQQRKQNKENTFLQPTQEKAGKQLHHGAIYFETHSRFRNTLNSLIFGRALRVPPRARKVSNGLICGAAGGRPLEQDGKLMDSKTKASQLLPHAHKS